MTNITKRKRDEVNSWISDFTRPCFSHVGLISYDTYRQAFFTEGEIELIERAKQLVDIDSEQTNLQFEGLAVGNELFQGPVHNHSSFRLQGLMPIPAWSKRNEVKDEFAWHKIEQAAFDVLHLSVDIGVFAFAARRCLDLSSSWEELGANFPPFVAIANKAREPEIAAAMMGAKTIKPLPLQPHERAAVKYALNWTAVQNLIGSFTSMRQPDDMLRLTKNSTTLQHVTFAGNGYRHQLMY
jgi:hypothetical protein